MSEEMEGRTVLRLSDLRREAGEYLGWLCRLLDEGGTEALPAAVLTGGVVHVQALCARIGLGRPIVYEDYGIEWEDE